MLAGVARLAQKAIWEDDKADPEEFHEAMEVPSYQ